MKANQSLSYATTALRGVKHLAFVAALSLAPPAFAQIAKVNATMSMIQSILVGVAVTVFTIAIMWVGYKMAFQHAKWSEVSNIVIGGILLGGAPAIAAMVVA